MVIEKLRENDFSLNYKVSGNKNRANFIFDEELFKETPLSTRYTYGVNEIVWNELEKQDANRHITHQDTLLKDFLDAGDVVQAAIEFYCAFPSITSMRRILSRIPRTDCFDEVSMELRDFICEKLGEIKLGGTDQEASLQEEFLTTVGILIRYSQNIQQVDAAITIITDKNARPNYNIIGELYSVRQRLGKDIDLCLESLRNKYELKGDNFFSLRRKINSLNMQFDAALNVLKGCPLFSSSIEVKSKIDQSNLEKLLHLLANKGETQEQWNSLFELHRRTCIKLRRSTIRLYFSVVADQNQRPQQERDDESYMNLIEERLRSLIDDSSNINIIADEDKESCYFYSIGASWNFKQAHYIYQLYADKYKSDNPLLISTVLRKVCKHEFQEALKFLSEVDKKLKEKGVGLSSICFNNLIKSAPNMGEALGVVPYITQAQLQDHTLVNILNILKLRRRKNESAKIGQKQDDPSKQDPIFSYAYSAFMREVFVNLRTSPHVIGVLYDLAMTPKHEDFIRNIFLKGMADDTKCKIIDGSTSISSIRLQKNYRTLDEAWAIFTTCRDYYCDVKTKELLYINSELYSSLIRKIKYQCKMNDDLLEEQRNKIRAFIKQDYDRIIRDKHFVSALYRFFPEKQVIDDEGNISNDFVTEIRLSKISQVQHLNTIMGDLKSRGFDIAWKFYEFMVSYYEQNSKHQDLRPDIRTFRYLRKAITTQDQLQKVVEESRLWGLEVLLTKNNNYNAKANELGCNIPNTNEKDRPEEHAEQNYKQRADSIINMVENHMNSHDSITPTQFNQYLGKIQDIIKDICKDPNIARNIAEERKKEIYIAVQDQLINKYSDKLCFDARSYGYLIKITPSENIGRWIEEIKAKKEIYKYDMVLCAVIARSVEVCEADINTALEYFKFWEEIVQNIGYDPADPRSISEATKITRYNNRDDYDLYWYTRSTHCKHEMTYYWKCLKNGDSVNIEALRFLKQQMELFEKHNMPFPRLEIDGQVVIDFKEELNKYNNI